jgi:hypothetical protein
MPSDVRWNSLVGTVESYINNWSILVQVCEEAPECVVDAVIKKLVQNVTLKRNTGDLLKLLKPISLALDSTQKDTCSISDAVDIWKKLERELNDLGNLSSGIMTSVGERRNSALTPAHLLAYLLHPKFAGCGLTTGM